MIFEEVNCSIEEVLEIILTKRFNVESHIKGYHAYMNEWTPEVGEILKNRLEPDRYRKNMVQKIMWNLEKNNALPEVAILKAMQILFSAWNPVSTETIVNCFRKAGISTENHEVAIADEGFQGFAEWDWCFTRRCVPEDVNAASLTDVDAEVSAVQPPLTDSKILAKLFENGNIVDGYDEVMDGLEENLMEFPGNLTSYLHWDSSKFFLVFN